MHEMQSARQNRRSAGGARAALECPSRDIAVREGHFERRFTILEGLLAIVLLAILLIAAAPLFYYGQQLMYRSSIRRRAVELGTEKVESLMNAGFDQVEDDEQEIDLGPVSGVMITIVQDAYTDPEGEGYKAVRVVVAWTAGGKEDQLVLTTYVSSAAPTG